MATKEPRNPFYFLLLAVSALFVATALAYGIFPVLDENAFSVGQKTPPSAFRRAIRTQGPLWLIYELSAMTVAVILSLGLDWLRSSKDQASAPDVSSTEEPPPPA
jgi:hypothetical protein